MERRHKYWLTSAGFEVLGYRRICFYPGPEGSGVFTMLMSAVYRFSGRRWADGVTRAFTRLFRFVEGLRIFNQKQLWVLRA